MRLYFALSASRRNLRGAGDFDLHLVLIQIHTHGRTVEPQVAEFSRAEVR